MAQRFPLLFRPHVSRKQVPSFPEYATLVEALADIRRSVDRLGAHLQACSSDPLTLRARARRSRQIQTTYHELVARCDRLQTDFGAQYPELVTLFAALARHIVVQPRAVKSALRKRGGLE